METPPTTPRRSRPSATRGVDEFLNSRVNQVTITLLADLDGHLAAAAAGDAESIGLVQRVSHWLTLVEAGAALRCLGCDNNLRCKDDVDGFAIINTFADPSRGMTGGLCHRCVEGGGDLLELVRARAAEIWDSVQLIAPGRS
jgi:hypothetical protein